MLRIINYGHSCFKFVSDTLSVVFDPYEGIKGLQMKEIDANYCFTSHNHHDHNATQFINLIPTENTLNIEAITVPHDHHNGAHRGLNKIHIFTMGGYKIAHFGDLGCIPNKEVLDQLKNFDIILAPINGFYTISAEELLQIMDLINPKLTIPMHYYRKENDSGLPDDNEIDILKKNKPYNEVNQTSIIVEDSLFDKPLLVFKKSEGDLR